MCKFKLFHIVIDVNHGGETAEIWETHNEKSFNE